MNTETARLRYGDLIEGDETLAETAATLDALMRSDPPSGLAFAIRARAGELALPPPARALPIAVTWPRISAPLIALLAVLALSASALAFGLANRAFEHDSGARSVEAQMVAVDQTREVEGFAVTIQSAYIDANRLIVAYTVRPNAAAVDRASITSATATTTDGISLPWSQTVMEKVATGTADGLISFDTGAITGSPGSVAVRLTIANLYVETQTSSATLPSPAQPSQTPDTHIRHSVAVNLPFDISLPFHPGTQVTPMATATWNGRTATLRRVVVTDTETRIYVAGSDAACWAEIRDSSGTVAGSDWCSPGATKAIGFFVAPPAPGTVTITVAEKPLAGGGWRTDAAHWSFEVRLP